MFTVVLWCCDDPLSPRHVLVCIICISVLLGNIFVYVFSDIQFRLRFLSILQITIYSSQTCMMTCIDDDTCSPVIYPSFGESEANI